MLKIDMGKAVVELMDDYDYPHDSYEDRIEMATENVYMNIVLGDNYRDIVEGNYQLCLKDIREMQPTHHIILMEIVHAENDSPMPKPLKDSINDFKKRIKDLMKDEIDEEENVLAYEEFDDIAGFVALPKKEFKTKKEAYNYLISQSLTEEKIIEGHCYNLYVKNRLNGEEDSISGIIANLWDEKDEKYFLETLKESCNVMLDFPKSKLKQSSIILKIAQNILTQIMMVMILV